MDEMDVNTTRKEAYQTSARRRPKMGKAVLFLVIILFAGYLFYGESIRLKFIAEGYQAVFLANGQVYFGKLSASGKWLKLSDIYYLHTSDALQQVGGAGADNSGQNIQLVKLGSELHGPADAMYLERDKVLFWENLKGDSRVVDAIKKYQAR